MAQQLVALGTGPNTPGSDTQFEAHGKHNANTTELYDLVGKLLGPGSFPAIIRPPYRPERYGAAFDGTTNDTPAWTDMATAITAAGGGDVLVPSGISRVNAGLALPQNCVIRGKGRYASRLTRAAGSNGTLLTAIGADSPTRHMGLVFDDIGIYGNDGTGALFRSVYASEHHMRNTRFYGNAGPAIQLVECWDSNFDFVYAEWCGLGGALATDNASVLGDDVIQLWAGIAASGAGSSFDSCNNVNFNNLRVETFVSPALSFRKGASGAGVGIAQIRMNGCKVESGSAWASQFMIGFSADVRDVVFRDTYLAAIAAGGAAATAGTCSFVNFIPHSACAFYGGRAYIAPGIAAAFNSAFSCYTNSQNRIEGFYLDGAAPTGGSNRAIIKIAGGANVPWARVEPVPGITCASTYPVYAASA